MLQSQALCSWHDINWQGSLFGPDGTHNTLRKQGTDLPSFSSVALKRMIVPISVVCLLLVHESFISGFASVVALLWTHKTISWDIQPEWLGYIFNTPDISSDTHPSQISYPWTKLLVSSTLIHPCFGSILFFSFPKERKKPRRVQI